MTPNLHLWLIPVLPLVGAAINGLLGKKFSRQTVAAVALAFQWRGVCHGAAGGCLGFSSSDHTAYRVLWLPGSALESFRWTSPFISTSFRW